MSGQNGKVIQLPVKPKGQPAEDTHKPRTREHRFVKQRRNIILSASIVTIVLGVTMVNKVILDQPLESIDAFQSHPSRSIASLKQTGSEVRDAEWERRLAAQLTRTGSRSPASIGVQPTAEDKLQFGFLEGKYAVKMTDGKIENVRFVASSEMPKYLDNRRGFIEMHRGLFGANFQEARLDNRDQSGRTIYETYTLVSGTNEVAKVSFELDLQGRLLNLAVAQSQD